MVSALKQTGPLRPCSEQHLEGPTSLMGDLGFTLRAAAISCSWFTSSVMDSRSSGLTFSVAPAAGRAHSGPQGPTPTLVEVTDPRRALLADFKNKRGHSMKSNNRTKQNDQKPPFGACNSHG